MKKINILFFGITGDLSKRMLIPAIETLLKNKLISLKHIYGVSRRDFDIDDLLCQSLNDKASDCLIKPYISTLKLSDNLSEYEEFKKKLNLSRNEELIIYLSVPPANAIDYVNLLGRAKLNMGNVKLMIEKPFGTDLDSAKEFLSVIDKYYYEEQVYKIDHYLGKSSALQLLEYRLRNPYKLSKIEKINVIALESLDIQGRVTFYEQTGALRDFVQGHLMELLLLSICKIKNFWIKFLFSISPSLFTTNDLKKFWLHSRTAAINDLELSRSVNSIRSQYIGYRDEVSNQNSCVETFACVPLISKNKNLEGAQFNLIAGKAMNHKESSITIFFKDKTKLKFDISPANHNSINSSNYKDKLSQELDGYPRIIRAACYGDKFPFTTNEEIIKSWTILDNLLKEWKNSKNKDLKTYKKGSSLNDIVS
ncbi:MAG: glucose-6-phosphate dehydrogenase [Mycoplasmoidaceae bacterium]|nr:MAG: glucose-6-phosphate dehydrogenase [Mycoplasmoidaceae bacterium]